MRSKDDYVPAVLVALAIMVLVPLLLWAIAYRRYATIVVDGRWWDTTTSVQYTTTTITTTCLPDPDSGLVSCTTDTDTDTHTRCAVTITGTTLPVVWPEPGCTQRSGDFVTNTVVYRIDYHVEDSRQSKRAAFNGSHWDHLAPGQVVQAEFNITGNLTGVAPTER